MRVQLEEKHEREVELLRSSMALAHREELLQVRTDLADRYFNEIQELKNKHSLELEQLKARLSESHVKGEQESGEQIYSIASIHYRGLSYWIPYCQALV